MVNVRSIANRATSGVNQNISAVARICTGYDKDASYRQVPTYADSVPVTIQAQALTKPEIEHLDNMNMSSATRGVYANLQLTGIDRTTKSGGDILTFAEPLGPQAGVMFDWLVTAVLEGWSTAGWCKVAVARQMPDAS